jgi:hypothetical protein
MDYNDASGLICDTFDKWLVNEDINLFKESNVIEALGICLNDCIENGDDSPAFYKDTIKDDDINDVLHYISDRWFCSGRIRFILRVIKEYYK